MFINTPHIISVSHIFFTEKRVKITGKVSFMLSCRAQFVDAHTKAWHWLYNGILTLNHNIDISFYFHSPSYSTFANGGYDRQTNAWQRLLAFILHSQLLLLFKRTALLKKYKQNKFLCKLYWNLFVHKLLHSIVLRSPPLSLWFWFFLCFINNMWLAHGWTPNSWLSLPSNTWGKLMLTVGCAHTIFIW